jgi:ElaB/YqjD/DUF883 family membrane-anchored ribosome-binding protein
LALSPYFKGPGTFVSAMGSIPTNRDNKSFAGRPAAWRGETRAGTTIIAWPDGADRGAASVRRVRMLGFSSHSGAKSAKAAEIEQRLGGGMSAGAAETADHVSDHIASALSSMARRFLGSANSVSILGGASSEELGKFAGGAAQLGNDAVRRIAREIKHRPLATLAVAIGVGVVVGLIGHRR